MTREIRLNNPMGLKKSEDHFKGEVQPSTDTVFKQFLTEVDGIRAGAKVLLTYYHIHALITIAGIVNRWAPGSENDTDSYIADVAHHMGYTANEMIDLDKPAVLENLVAAIIYHENGQNLDSLLIKDGVMLAYA